MKTLRKNSNSEIISNATLESFEVTGENCVNVTIKYNQWDSTAQKENEVTQVIPFWNNIKNANAPQYADRIKKFNPKSGTPVSVLTFVKNEKVYGNGICFYDGLLKIKDDEGESNVISGRVQKCETRVVQTKNGEKKIFSAAIPISTGVKGADGNYESEWYNVTLWNSDKAAMADRAEKVIKKGDVITFSCGDLKVTEKGYKNLTAFRFEVISKGKKKDEDTDETTSTESFDEPENKPITSSVADVADDEDEDEDDYPF